MTYQTDLSSRFNEMDNSRQFDGCSHSRCNYSQTGELKEIDILLLKGNDRFHMLLRENRGHYNLDFICIPDSGELSDLALRLVNPDISREVPGIIKTKVIGELRKRI